MALNKQKGNMYPWITHTWNPIRGKCLHDCIYCYMKALKKAFSVQCYLSEKELETNLGDNNTIFVGSSTDMWGWWVEYDWIKKVLDHCKEFDNTYLFQTKNPRRFHSFLQDFPKKTILGCTIETNRDYGHSGAPSPKHRMYEMWSLAGKIDTMISIEPIVAFDEGFDLNIRSLAPKFVSIGADSKKHGLPEPTSREIELLISRLHGYGIDVRSKSNIDRILLGGKNNSGMPRKPA